MYILIKLLMSQVSKNINKIINTNLNIIEYILSMCKKLFIFTIGYVSLDSLFTLSLLHVHIYIYTNL